MCTYPATQNKSIFYHLWTLNPHWKWFLNRVALLIKLKSEGFRVKLSCERFTCVISHLIRPPRRRSSLTCKNRLVGSHCMFYYSSTNFLNNLARKIVPVSSMRSLDITSPTLKDTRANEICFTALYYFNFFSGHFTRKEQNNWRQVGTQKGKQTFSAWKFHTSEFLT